MALVNAAKLQRAYAVLERGLEQRVYAGAVAAVGDHTGIIDLRAIGRAAVTPDIVPMGTDTRFDLASLTKVVATTPAVLALLEQGAFVLETPVRELLPDFSDPRVTVRHLLTHTSGLPGWAGLYLDHRGWAAYEKAICAMPLEADPGARVEYSDLGFILLGCIIQRVTGESIAEYCGRTVFEPLGMNQTGWLPSGPREQTAATETGNTIEYGMCGDRAAGFPRWRRGVIWGEANDGNAHYGLDGISSHAGLFGTAADLAAYARFWLTGEPDILGDATRHLATRLFTGGLGSARGLGWQKPPVHPEGMGRVSCGDMFSASAFGHTGFTGTSLWIDPEKDLFVILLTNRLHPHASDGLVAYRPAFHNAVVSSLRQSRGEIR